MSNITYPTSNNNQPLIQNLDCYQTYFEIDHPRDGFGKTLVKIVLWIFCFWFLIPWKALRAGTTEQDQTLPATGTGLATTPTTTTPTTTIPATPTTPTSTVATTTSAITRSAAPTAAALDPRPTVQSIRFRYDNARVPLARYVLPQNGNIRYRIILHGGCAGEICLAIRSNHVEIISYSNNFNNSITAEDIEEAKRILIRSAVEESNSHGFGGRVTTTAGDPQLAEMLHRQSTGQAQQTVPTTPTPPATTVTTTTQASTVATPALTQPRAPATAATTAQIPVVITSNPTQPVPSVATTTSTTTTQASVVVTTAPTHSTPAATRSSTQQSPVTPPAPSTTQTTTVATSAAASITMPREEITREVTDSGKIRYTVTYLGRSLGTMLLAVEQDHIVIMDLHTESNPPGVMEALIAKAIHESFQNNSEGRVTTEAGSNSHALFFQQGFVPTEDRIAKYGIVPEEITEWLQSHQFRTANLTTLIPTLSHQDYDLLKSARLILHRESGRTEKTSELHSFALTVADLQMIKDRWYWDENYPMEEGGISRRIQKAIADAGPSGIPHTRSLASVAMHLSPEGIARARRALPSVITRSAASTASTTASTTAQASAVATTPAPTQPRAPATAATTAQIPVVITSNPTQPVPSVATTTSTTTTQASVVVTTAPTHSTPAATTSSTQHTSVTPPPPSTMQTTTVAASPSADPEPTEDRRNGSYRQVTTSGHIHYSLWDTGREIGEMLLVIKPDHIEINRLTIDDRFPGTSETLMAKARWEAEQLRCTMIRDTGRSGNPAMLLRGYDR